MSIKLALLSVASTLKGGRIQLDLDPLIDGFVDGADVLIDIIIELLPFVILIGLATVIILAFKFKGR